MPTLSIIVPVYKVEAYLPRCIDSILAQEYSDFELILIDDGSPDQCGAIIDEYAARDNRIIPIHQENKGVSAARNHGLRVARGTYIGFVDSDDWINPKMYSILIQNMISNNCDIACCLFCVADEQENIVEIKSNISTQLMDKEDIMKHLFDMPPSIYGSACIKLFKNDVISAEFSEKYTHCEDNLFVAQCIALSNKSIFINDCLYYYYERKNSAGRREIGITALGLPARRKIIEVASSVSRECGDIAEMNYLDQCVTFASRTIGARVTYRDLARKEYLSYIKDNPFCLFKNRKLSIKQRVFYLIKIFEFVRRKNVLNSR